MRFKRYFTLLCIIVMSVMIFGGCSENNEEDNKPTGTLPEITDTEGKPEDTTNDDITETVTEPVTEPVTSNDETAKECIYTIKITDEDGIPVEGAMIQFCSDTMCMTGKTDPNGTVCFTDEPGNYEVHVLKAPAGYLKDDTVYETGNTSDTITIVLNRDIEQKIG